MAFRQVVMGVDRSPIVADLANWSLIEKQTISLLAGIGLAGAGLGAPGAWVTHVIFLSSVITDASPFLF
jgi:hypothetical protein